MPFPKHLKQMSAHTPLEPHRASERGRESSSVHVHGQGHQGKERSVETFIEVCVPRTLLGAIVVTSRGNSAHPRGGRFSVTVSQSQSLEGPAWAEVGALALMPGLS